MQSHSEKKTASDDFNGLVHSFDMMPNGSGAGVKELASLSLNIQSKKFYLDVKENLSGRFLKVAEINVSGIKNKVILDMLCSRLLLDHLVSFAEFYVALGPQPPLYASSAGGFGMSRPLKSASFKRPQAYDRVYHLDLAENEKGVFLKLSCANQSGARTKQAVVFPAQGIVEFRDKLKQLLDEWYTEEVQVDLPQPRKLAFENRLLFMDVSFNPRSSDYLLKMSEVSKQPSATCRRQTIQIPRNLWREVRDTLDDLMMETSVLSDEPPLEEKQQAVEPSAPAESDVTAV